MRTLLVGMLRRNFIEFRRYAFDTFFQIAGVYLLFVLVFFGAKGLGGSNVQTGDSLSAIVLGFVVFLLVIMSYQTVANWMTNEATLGTLEQIAMSPFGFLNVLLAEYTSALVTNGAIVGSLLIVSEATSGRWLHLNALTLVPLLVLLLMQMLGIGLFLGGAAMLFKRITSLINLIQFGFLALIAAPVSRFHWMKLLPVALANDLIRRSAVQNLALTKMKGGDLIVVALTSVSYLACGVYLFHRTERTARARGVIAVH